MRLIFWFLWAEHSLLGAHPNLCTFPVKAEIFMKCQGWWWEMNFPSKCSLNSNQGLKGLLTCRKERWFVSDQTKQWAANHFRPSILRWWLMDQLWHPWTRRTPLLDVSLMISRCKPGLQHMVWGVMVSTLIYLSYLQGLDGARVEEQALHEADVLQRVGCEHQTQPLAFFSCLTVRCINYPFDSGFWPSRCSDFIGFTGVVCNLIIEIPISSLPTGACRTLCSVKRSQLLCTNCFQLIAMSKCQDAERCSHDIYRNISINVVFSLCQEAACAIP